MNNDGFRWWTQTHPFGFPYPGTFSSVMISSLWLSLGTSDHIFFSIFFIFLLINQHHHFTHGFDPHRTTRTRPHASSGTRGGWDRWGQGWGRRNTYVIQQHIITAFPSFGPFPAFPAFPLFSIFRELLFYRDSRSKTVCYDEAPSNNDVIVFTKIEHRWSF